MSAGPNNQFPSGPPTREYAMPTFLLIGSDKRLELMEDLAAIAELDPQDEGGVRFFEAVAWQSQNSSR